MESLYAQKMTDDQSFLKHYEWNGAVVAYIGWQVFAIFKHASNIAVSIILWFKYIKMKIPFVIATM